jgi:hypothetical protein
MENDMISSNLYVALLSAGTRREAYQDMHGNLRIPMIESLETANPDKGPIYPVKADLH